MQDQNNRISVLVVEADGLLRDMLRTVLAAEPRLRVVGVTGDATEAVRIAASEKPDVSLVGLSGESESDALAVAQSISSSRAGSRIVFLGEHPDRRTLAALPAFRAAGWSYLLRQSVTDVATLVRAIDGAAMGLVVLDPAVVESLGRRETRISALTKRQLEVLSLMAKGNNNAAIARALVLEEKSVENHINAIFGQLNLSRDNAAHPRVKAVLLYLQETANSGLDDEDVRPERKAA
ncbi:MAG: response regulator transcription factor [Dehalococcoidia bacterium]|nr:MAG: response regulator transcription factor [Dehalococcoidia bacterium]